MLRRIPFDQSANLVKKCILINSSAVIKESQLVYVEPDQNSIYLGHDGSVAYYCKTTSEPTRDRDFMNLKDSLELHLAILGKSVMNFHDLVKFCGCCGSKVLPDGFKKKCTNLNCITFKKTINISHPRVDPVVIVVIRSEDKILLGRQARHPKGFYSLISGFIDIAESAEEAVKRECMEETGLVVHDIKYFKSQAWPFPSQLMLGFTAICSDLTNHGTDGELEDIRWVSRTELSSALKNENNDFKVPPSGSISNILMKHVLSVSKL
eukprot:NODE_73_length_24441_cov_0.672952.p9 type:complete len:266 gc:universal NODE_73_length_24441_cov_0.672952:12248-11451(-)